MQCKGNDIQIWGWVEWKGVERNVLFQPKTLAILKTVSDRANVAIDD